MSGPNELLCRLYGTEKNAEIPIGGRVALGVLGLALAASAIGKMEQRHEVQHDDNRAFNGQELQRISPMNDGFRGRVRPMISPYGQPTMGMLSAEGVPVGYDDGMVRLASVARETGRLMAKQAMNVPPVPSMSGALSGIASSVGGLVDKAKALPGMLKGKTGLGWKGQLGLGAAGLGAAYLGTKAVNKGFGALGHEDSHPVNYGTAQYGGPRLANGVNQYGVPQVGTPFQ